ncbi:MAG: YrdB family protein [Alphaproteobacteria bacterium]
MAGGAADTPTARLAYHPVNLGLRFVLEIWTVAAFGVLPWERLEAWWKWPLVVLCPLLVMLVWGAFAVPGDRTRSGRPVPVATDGRIRLALELGLLTAGAAATWATGREAVAGLFAALIVVHYAVSYDRVRWLVRQQRWRS